MSEMTPVAYKGNQPYIFISYAHKDAELVLPVISHLQKEGFRIWYDEGIVPGSNWDVYISEHLNACCNVLAFLSKSYVKSQNCRDELALARLKQKAMNLVYLDDVQLSSGMKMRYGRIQALFLQNLSEEEFYEKLYRAESMKAARG